MSNWKESSHPARLEEILQVGMVRCHLSPRNCTLREGQHGFCGVRANRANRLVSLNYGKGVHATEETIETEAVNHYSPGERILSMGNIGCMLNCSYCHNWKTSQSRYVADRDVYFYTPEQVIDIAQRHGIRCISWTYNDPVVWHEFILDTAKLAKEAGMINLYKSAFFITEEAVEELLPYIDIFSISIKSIDPTYYKKFTSGWLEPVLNATKQVFKAGKHLEVSTLMITDISDDEKTAKTVSEWVLNELDSNVPVHFVRFHPDYKMLNTIRTPIPRLIAARQIAKEMGIQHVYVGNAYDTPFSNTYCNECNAELVTRYGLNAKNVGLDNKGNCQQCGRSAHFKLLPDAKPTPTIDELTNLNLQIRSFNWHGEIRSLHIQLLNRDNKPIEVYSRRLIDGLNQPWTILALNPGESYRYNLTKSSSTEFGVEIAMPTEVDSNLHEVFDRAHFPTVSIEEASSVNDISPLPIFSIK